MCVCVSPKYPEPECLVTCVWPRFDHKPSEVEGRIGARTPDPSVHFRLELLLFLTTNNSGEARPGPPGSARLSCSESSVVTTHTFPTLRVLESDRTLVEGNFHPQPSAGALFRPRAGCLESQSRKECLRAMTSRLPGRQTTCRDQPAAARRFMLQHHGCIKKGGKKRRDGG